MGGLSLLEPIMSAIARGPWAGVFLEEIIDPVSVPVSAPFPRLLLSQEPAAHPFHSRHIMLV